MNHILGNIVESFLFLTIQNSILIVFIFVLTRGIKRLSSSHLYFIWMVTFAGIFLMPVLNKVVPAFYTVNPFSLINNVPDRIAPETLLDNPGPEIEIPIIPEVGKLKQSPGPELLSNSDDVASSNTTGKLAEQTVFAKISSIKLPILLSVIWWIGIVLLSLHFLIGRIVLFYISKGATNVVSGDWLHLTNKIQYRTKITRPVRLLKSSRISSPVTCGTIWPKILLPANADQWTTEQKKYVLLHEQAHIKRFDDIAQLFTQTISVINWFNPLVWFAFRQTVKEREKACDAYVVSGVDTPSNYAYFLLEIAKGIKRYRLFAFSTLYMARKSELEGRLLDILHSKTNPSKFRYLTGIITLSVLVLILSISSLQPQEQSLENDTIDSEASELVNFRNELSPVQNQENVQTTQESVDIATLISLLAKAITDSSKGVRIETVKTLGKMGGPEAITILLLALKDPSDDVREKVVQVLDDQNDPRIVPALVNALSDPDGSVREQVLEALGKFKQASVAPDIIPLLKDKDDDVRDEAAETLGDLGNPIAMQPLRSLLSDKNWKVQRTSIKALGRLGDSQAIPIITEKLSDDRWRLRETAAWALGNIRHKDAMIPLTTGINDKNDEVREEIAKAFGKIGHTDAVVPLKKLLFDEESDVREEAAKALLLIDAPLSFKELEKALRGTNTKAKMDILEALEDYKQNKGVDLLRIALSDPNTKVRRKAVQTCRKYNKDQAMSLLQEALNDRSDSVRKEAAESLGEFFD